MREEVDNLKVNNEVINPVEMDLVEQFEGRACDDSAIWVKRMDGEVLTDYITERMWKRALEIQGEMTTETVELEIKKTVEIWSFLSVYTYRTGPCLRHCALRPYYRMRRWFDPRWNRSFSPEYGMVSISTVRKLGRC